MLRRSIVLTGVVFALHPAVAAGSQVDVSNNILEITDTAGVATTLMAGNRAGGIGADVEITETGAALTLTTAADAVCDLAGSAVLCTNKGTGGRDPFTSIIVSGGAGDDRLRANGSFATTLNGGAGADVLTGGLGEDILLGFGGEDQLLGSDDDDRLEGGADRDLLSGQNGNDTLDGGEGDDTLQGLAGSDTLRGRDGDDDLQGGIDTDVQDGGDGLDIASYEGVATGGLVANLGTGTTNQGETLVAIDGLVGTAEADVVTGTDGPNVFRTRNGNDRIDALGGDDLLQGGNGADELLAGGGRDTAAFQDAAGGVTLTLVDGAGDATSLATDRLTGVEDVIGTNGIDKITGDAGANTIDGLDGDDTLTGGGGADALKGGLGSDRLEARDEAADASLSCGEPVPGRPSPDADVAVVDFADPEVPDCETVERTAAPPVTGSGGATGGGTTGGAGAGTGGAGAGGAGTRPPVVLKAARLSLAGKVTRTARGRRLVARATFAGSCSGSVVITTKAGKAAAKRSTVALKRSRGVCRFTVRLPRRGRVAVTATLRKPGYVAATAKRTVR